MIKKAKKGFGERKYRHRVKSSGLVCFRLMEGESDLQVSACRDLQQAGIGLLREVRGVLQDYINQNQAFASALAPLEIQAAPNIILQMSAAAKHCAVGPMAAVAGAVAQEIGRGLRALSSELIIENGGDLYLCGKQQRTVAIYAGDSPLSWKLGLKVNPAGGELGVGTSSASVGPSLSFGAVDAAVVLADSAIMADALATALGNKIERRQDIAMALEWAHALPGVKGALAIVGEDMGACGELELVEL